MHKRKSMNPRYETDLESSKKLKSDEWKPILAASLYKKRRGKSSKHSLEHRSKEFSAALRYTQTQIDITYGIEDNFEKDDVANKAGVAGDHLRPEKVGHEHSTFLKMSGGNP